jgi:hypothetical protein
VILKRSPSGFPWARSSVDTSGGKEESSTVEEEAEESPATVEDEAEELAATVEDETEASAVEEEDEEVRAAVEDEAEELVASAEETIASEDPDSAKSFAARRFLFFTLFTSEGRYSCFEAQPSLTQNGT